MTWQKCTITYLNGACGQTTDILSSWFLINANGVSGVSSDAGFTGGKVHRARFFERITKPTTPTANPSLPASCAKITKFDEKDISWVVSNTCSKSIGVELRYSYARGYQSTHGPALVYDPYQNVFLQGVLGYSNLEVYFAYWRNY
jgi:hypothetical protein